MREAAWIRSNLLKIHYIFLRQTLLSDLLEINKGEKENKTDRQKRRSFDW